ncbi:MAG: HAMP domain-containing histidine kinase, partial [Acidaminococcaceae bacterium]|nr:HAMP domain-containing histidine kinase [Acidaminococcaceae bacterium]
RLGRLNRDVCRTGRPINANEKMPLSDLFEEGSEEFKKFTVELKQGIAGEGEFMQQALCEVTMVPVMDTADPARVIACMALIGICNSDYYFPSYISSKATNGFLVLTVDGVHVSTKSTEGEDRSWIVGHKAGSITSSKADDGTYSGKIYLRGIPHLFIDHPLKNYSGDLVGYISFGLQEDQFSGIVEDNRKQTMVIGLLCFVLFAPLIWLMASQVRQNQKHLELLVRRRTKDLESAVDELKQLNETKNRFLSNITHELRTPLCVIINACDFLKGGYSGTLNEKQFRYVDNASECGSHLLTLINNLLDLTRLRSGKTKADFTRFFIHGFVEAIVNEMRNFRPDAHITMQLGFEPDNFEITADHQMLRQIIYNLLSNALKFSPPDSRISICVQKMEESKQMRLSIADQGIGIAPENLERVFKEFEQIEHPMTKKQSGTGLGLPIVKKLAELHHGTISLRSEPGKGTEAILLLPLEQEGY